MLQLKSLLFAFLLARAPTDAACVAGDDEYFILGGSSVTITGSGRDYANFQDYVDNAWKKTIGSGDHQSQVVVLPFDDYTTETLGEFDKEMWSYDANVVRGIGVKTEGDDAEIGGRRKGKGEGILVKFGQELKEVKVGVRALFADERGFDETATIAAYSNYDGAKTSPSLVGGNPGVYTSTTVAGETYSNGEPIDGRKEFVVKTVGSDETFDSILFYSTILDHDFHLEFVEGCIDEDGGGSGDPHFKTWTGERYDFHGLCDLVLLQNPDFEDKLGMDIHIRTKQTKQWSLISNAVLRIGEDTLEVKGSSKQEEGHQYWINGVLGGSLKKGISGFSILHSKPSSTQEEFEIIIDHHSSIIMKTFKDFVRVDVKGSSDTFRGSRGLMGLYGSGARLGRQGEEAIEDFIVFGMEWQVLPSEDMLFHNVEGPQAPIQCVLPKLSNLRRRLEETGITLGDAELACSRVSKADFDSCVFDVLATNDKEIAGAY